MSSATYTAQAIVLHKTKLKESDLILRMLQVDGSLLEAVAKGARKPNSAASARLELFNCVDLLLAKGKSLDIIKETRLIRANAILHQDPAYNAASSVIAECASKLAQPSLESAKAYPMTNKCFEILAEAEMAKLPLVTAAYLFKASAIAGCRPTVHECCVCGSSLPAHSIHAKFSFNEGGVLCDTCRSTFDCEYFPQNMIDWIHYLLCSTFKEISETTQAAPSIDLVNLGARWLDHQLGIKLKALSSLLIYCANV